MSRDTTAQALGIGQAAFDAALEHVRRRGGLWTRADGHAGRSELVHGLELGDVGGGRGLPLLGLGSGPRLLRRLRAVPSEIQSVKLQYYPELSAYVDPDGVSQAVRLS